MNFKDAILSTISEIESIHEESVNKLEPKLPFAIQEKRPLDQEPAEQALLKNSHRAPLEKESSPIIEERLLEDLRERILVLFEGFQSPNNNNIEAKIDLTLNFLEHLLAQIDKQLDKIK